MFRAPLGAAMSSCALSLVLQLAFGVSSASAQVADFADASDEFGSALATGDFDGDGLDDLAISVPYEDEKLGILDDIGAVSVLYGRITGGLSSKDDQLWNQEKGLKGDADWFEYFGGWGAGPSIAAGDFDGNGFDDLAIGVSSDLVALSPDAGSVNVLYGTMTGLTNNGDLLWNQDSAGIQDAAEATDRFGVAVATGDFDGDGFDDLAMCVADEDFGHSTDAGMAHVLYGSQVGLTSKRSQVWHQDKGTVLDSVESFEHFCASLAVGDFDANGCDDLVIGAPFESLGNLSDAGAVNVLYGATGTGLTDVGNQLWTQSTLGVENVADRLDVFGSPLAIGDFDGDGFDDLAIGVPGEDVGGLAEAGAVNVLFGSLTGLTEVDDQFWNLDNAGPDLPEFLDLFGEALAAADFDGDGVDDLAVGVPRREVAGLQDAGAVLVLHGVLGLGLVDAGGVSWAQDDLLTTNVSEEFDNFGAALAAGDFDGDGFADLAIGAPKEDVGTITAAGAIGVVPGSVTGLTAINAQSFDQNSP
jgi:hypothetical protein